jgi:Raf kinase inhibitor-like YbhB/YbcL family protein
MLPLVLGLALATTACAARSSPEASAMTDAIHVTSSAFTQGGTIPAVYSCDGDDRSPPLEWTGAPEGTAAFALIVDDPDARGFVHWAVADIPADRTSVAEGSSPGTDGRSSFGRAGYGGPCPPSGSHRYVFTVYALSERLGLDAGFSVDELRAAMDGRVLAQGSLTASYSR